MRSKFYDDTPLLLPLLCRVLGEPPMLILLLSLCSEACSTSPALSFKELSSCQALGEHDGFHNEIKQFKVVQLRASQ